MTAGVEPSTHGLSGQPTATNMEWDTPTSGTSGVRWRHRYRRRVQLTDLLSVSIAVIVAQQVRFGGGDVVLHGSLTYFALSGILVTAWMVVLGASGAWHGKVIGHGLDEYRKVTLASVLLFGLLAIAAYLGKLEIARGYVAVALPTALTLLWLSRWFWRGWLRRSRIAGRCLDRTIVVGSAQSALALARRLRSQPQAGFEILGLCIGNPDSAEIDRFPVLGGLTAIPDIAGRYGATTIAVTKTPEFPPGHVSRLAWALEDMDIHLVLVPMLTAIAGPRIHAEPVPGLPLIHVEKPRIGGFGMAVKSVIDVCGSLAGLLLLSPVMMAVAIGIKAHDRGPVLYKQERVGRDGRQFRMWKFRSMVVDADKQWQALRGNSSYGADDPRLKVKNDPRITPIGRFIRRYSIDEVPQLFNVLKGEMSLVGPRPPLPGEVLRYGVDDHRRLAVKPGITGLWQVSGRSDLSWEESVRLDLHYVENWSLINDFIILAKTIGAVAKSVGAY